jgi:LPXTG-site transpeptidase (sortase) family protein
MPDEPQETPEKRRKRSRSWKYWLANTMIVVGVLLLAYVPSTWAYTWFQQRGLENQLEQSSPQITAVEADLNASDFIPLEDKSQAAEASSTTEAEAAAQAAAEAAAQAAAAQKQALLDAFKSAAETFEASIIGETGEPIGKIIIPSIGMDVIVVEGTGKGDLKVGPGHWPETPLPGEGGNFVVSGHRTTYGAPFLKLNKVEVGDEIDVILPYAVARYTVTRVVIVLPTEVNEVAQLGREQVSLAACHPLYSAKQRIVVQGDLTSFKLLSAQG